MEEQEILIRNLDSTEELSICLAPPKNGFVPEIQREPGTATNNPRVQADIIYLCNPNNPTGAVMNHDQLKVFVDFAIERKSAIIYDAAYAEFISDDTLPRSIYEIPGAKDCAIELNSFSKDQGFTGLRLGFAVVPKSLSVRGEAGKIHSNWNRRQCTKFNGASNIIQAGGLAALTEEGQAEGRGLVEGYMENARIIREGVLETGLTVHGGTNAPYIWVETPNEMSSWDFFDKVLNETHIVGTPGSGFGPSGEGFFRLSAFGHKGDIEAAVKSIKENLQLD